MITRPAEQVQHKIQSVYGFRRLEKMHELRSHYRRNTRDPPYVPMAFAKGHVFGGSELPSSAAGLSLHVSSLKTFRYTYSATVAFQTARQPQGTVGGSGDCGFVAATSAAHVQSPAIAALRAMLTRDDRWVTRAARPVRADPPLLVLEASALFCIILDRCL